MSADEAMDKEQGEERHQWEEAKTWLEGILAEGPVPAQVIFSEGMDKYGYSKKTLRKAGAKLKLEYPREGFGPGSKMFWQLPDEPIHDPKPHTYPVPNKGEVCTGGVSMDEAEQQSGLFVEGVI